MPDVCDWLREYLRDGQPHDTEEVKQAARAAGYTRGDLRDARMICGVRTTNNAKAGIRGVSRWFWSLPEDRR